MGGGCWGGWGGHLDGHSVRVVEIALIMLVDQGRWVGMCGAIEIFVPPTLFDVIDTVWQ